MCGDDKWFHSRLIKIVCARNLIIMYSDWINKDSEPNGPESEMVSWTSFIVWIVSIVHRFSTDLAKFNSMK